MKKRYMIALLTAAMLSMTACGSGEETESTTETTEDTTEEAVVYEYVSHEDLVSTIKSLGEYVGVEGEKILEEVTDENVQSEIETVKRQYATLTDVDRPAALGDVTVIDFTGYVDGETSDGLQGTEFSLELGSGQFVPGFEEQLVGVTAEQDVEVNITFPEDYYEDMAGKDARFEVHVHKVQEYVNEDWSDAFVKENVGYESIADMEATIRSDLEQAAEENAEADLEYELMMKVIEASEFQVEEADIEAYTEEMLNEYRSYATMYGMELEDFLAQYVGKTEADLRELYKDTAAFRVKMILTLHKIAGEEGIEVTDEECTAKLEELAVTYGYEDAAAVEAVYSKEMIKEQLIQEKAIDLIRANAAVL